MARQLIETTDTLRRYKITDTSGEQIGEDVEYILNGTDKNAETLRQKLTAALDANKAFMSNGSPSAAQITAQVKLLTRENSALIRQVLGVLDDVSDT